MRFFVLLSTLARMDVVKTYKQFADGQGVVNALREQLRNMVIAGLSMRKSISGNNWIKLPYYHHVFDDERKGFEGQLKYLKNFGEFISMNDVWKMVYEDKQIDGRYFCVSFDDGFYNCYENMMPIIIYLPTTYINLDSNNPADAEKIQRFYPEKPRLVPFLSWQQCREMLSVKVSFGSHTVTHANLMKLNTEGILKEMQASKHEIEKELGVACEHFACPWGRSGIDFDASITTPIAQKLGYKTFATTNRGVVTVGDNLYTLKRDHLLANWGNYQLKYFFGI
jgi:hypothetical protein